MSTDALAAVAIGELPALAGWQVTNWQWPAIYSPTNEPILVKGTLVNLGDVAVSLASLDEAPELPTVSSAVLRITIYPSSTLSLCCPLFRNVLTLNALVAASISILLVMKKLLQPFSMFGHGNGALFWLARSLVLRLKCSRCIFEFLSLLCLTFCV